MSANVQRGDVVRYGHHVGTVVSAPYESNGKTFVLVRIEVRILFVFERSYDVPMPVVELAPA